MDYEQLYNALLDDVHGLCDDFRSMALGASDREAPAYEDAQDMTDDVLERTYKRNNNAAT